MNRYNQQLIKDGAKEVTTYPAEQFEQMISDTRPDTVIVTTIDSVDHLCIARAMIEVVMSSPKNR